MTMADAAYKFWHDKAQLYAPFSGEDILFSAIAAIARDGGDTTTQEVQSSAGDEKYDAAMAAHEYFNTLAFNYPLGSREERLLTAIALVALLDAGDIWLNDTERTDSLG